MLDIASPHSRLGLGMMLLLEFHAGYAWVTHFNDDNNVVLFDNVVNPETFNEDFNVISFKLELPLTFNIPFIKVLFDNVVIPETFNEDLNVASFKLALPLTFNIPLIEVLFDKVVKPDT